MLLILFLFLIFCNNNFVYLVEYWLSHCVLTVLLGLDK